LTTKNDILWTTYGPEKGKVPVEEEPQFDAAVVDCLFADVKEMTVLKLV